MEKLSSDRLLQTFLAIFTVTIIASLLVLVNSNDVMAFPHAITILEPDPNIPEQEHANKIEIVLGHANEPSFGKLAGIHDGKHGVEIFLSDLATKLPLEGATLFVDKYYFKNIKNFQKAGSLQKADSIQLNIPVTSVFGDPGHYESRQVQAPGIYGYTLTGMVNYFDVAEVPIPDTTIFCTSPPTDTSKFNSQGWFAGYGCTGDIRNIFFPK